MKDEIITWLEKQEAASAKAAERAEHDGNYAKAALHYYDALSCSDAIIERVSRPKQKPPASRSLAGSQSSA